MKTKLIKPSWFLVEKYDASKSFTKNDWLEQLAMRFMLYILPQNENFNQSAIDLFENIKSQVYPQSKIGVVALKQLVLSPSFSSDLNEVREIQFENWSKFANDALGLTNNSEEPENLSENITESFEININNFEPIEKTQTLNENQQKRWTMHRVLAYIDLILWCKLNNYVIKNHGDVTFTELTQWTFDDRDPYGVSRSQLKNVKKYESEMMNISFLIQLYKYANSV